MKLKSKKAAAKRFSFTATGKVKFKRTNKRHNLGNKSPGRKLKLRKAGIASATKKATRSTKQGVIGSYIHAGAQIGVLIEVNCESDFVARTEDFQELVHDLAMQVAAADPQFVRREEVTQAALDKERDLARSADAVD